MRATAWVSLAGFCVLALGASARTDDQGDAKAVVDKAIKAFGGEGKLSKFKAATWKGKGKIDLNGNEISFTADWTFQAPDQYRLAADADGMKFLRLVNGDKGWEGLGDNVEELTGDNLTDRKVSEVYHTWITKLPPLQDKAFTVASPAKAKVGSQGAMVVTVTSKGQPNVKLFFDEDKGLLLKSEMKVKRQGEERNVETFFSDYKETDGIQWASKVLTKVDGKFFLEIEISEFKPLEKVDAKTFEKP